MLLTIYAAQGEDEHAELLPEEDWTVCGTLLLSLAAICGHPSASGICSHLRNVTARRCREGGGGIELAYIGSFGGVHCLS